MDDENAQEKFTVTLRTSDKGGLMVVEWGGDEKTTPIWMGTDELLTLTPKETELRNALVTKIYNALPKDKSVEDKSTNKKNLKVQGPTIMALVMFITSAGISSNSAEATLITMIAGIVFTGLALLNLYMRQAERNKN